MTEPRSSHGGDAPDVFVTYCRDDRAQIERIVYALQLQSFDVWWDRRLEAGVAFDEEIAAALRRAKCVLVCWSRAAVASEWVRAEAAEGRRRCVLVSCRLEDCSPYPPFNILHDEDLSDWRGDVGDARWRRLLAAVADCRAERPRRKSPITAAARPHPLTLRVIAGLLGTVTVAAFAALAPEGVVPSRIALGEVQSAATNSPTIDFETADQAANVTTRHPTVEARHETNALEPETAASNEAAPNEAPVGEGANGETEVSRDDGHEHIEGEDRSLLITLVEHIGLRADPPAGDASGDTGGATGALDQE